jgi:hypothetical protein
MPDSRKKNRQPENAPVLFAETYLSADLIVAVKAVRAVTEGKVVRTFAAAQLIRFCLLYLENFRRTRSTRMAVVAEDPVLASSARAERVLFAAFEICSQRHVKKYDRIFTHLCLL